MPAPAGHIGARVKCGDDPRLLTGRGRYVDDLTLPRMAHVAFVRSPHAHARVTRVGLDAARRAPGVVGVLTGDGAARLCKGAGEAGATGAPAAILNAVNDALAPLGVMLTDQPITPERVMQALRQKR